MARIVKDYKNRRRTPANIARSESADQAKMAGHNGAPAAHQEGMINHQQSATTRSSRRNVPNNKLGKPRK